jgi:paraquat-inducible protein A
MHQRKPNSIARTWALVLAALILYIPANAFPVMTTTYVGKSQSDTILSGVQYLIESGMWPLAAIVFFASVTVPVVKLVVLSYLLLSIQYRSHWRPKDRTRLYRLTELVGRWSMVDIFVVAILVALVRIGNFATIEPGIGATAFGAVVVLTMFAAMTFDPRIIWDRVENTR